MQTQFGGKGDSDQASQASAVVRAISILYNNSRVYGIEHPVFRKTLTEHMPSFQAALSENKELVFSFLKGKVRCGTVLLDPTSTVFQAVSHMFEVMGVSGLCVRRGITSEEITTLIEILAGKSAEISQGGLQKILDAEKIRHISEKKVSLDMDGKTRSAAAPEKKKAETIVSEAASGSPRKTFELDDTIVDLGTVFGAPEEEPPPPLAPPPAPVPASGARTKGRINQFKNFVTDALTDLTWKKSSVSQVAEQISSEFEERLHEETEELRQETQKAVRRLENVKSIVFEKLEALDVMAILVDTELTVLAMTSPARDLIGDITTIPHDSPLGHCVKAKAAYMHLTLKGIDLTVQTIASDRTRAGEVILLLTLNTD